MRAALAGLAALVAVAAGGSYAQDAEAKRKPIRCATGAKRPEPCPKLRQVVPIRVNGTVGRAVALKAFAATVAPLPGVRPPKRGYPYLNSGTGPIRWVLDHWPKLTRRQQAAVRRALPGIAVLTAGTARGRPLQARATKVTLAKLQLLVPDAIKRLNAHFDPDMTVPVDVQVAKLKDAVALAYLDQPGTCQIRVAPASLSESLTYVREVMLHELTHCYQYQLGFFEPVPWLDEGSAEWVAAVVGAKWSGGTSARIRDSWKIYFKNFKQPLLQHAYSALGFFGHLAHTGSVAKVFASLSLAYQAKDAQKDAYGVLVDEQAHPFKATTAPSGTRLANLGASWDTKGPGLPDATQARYNPPTVTIGVPVKAPAYGHAVVGLKAKSAAEVVKLKVHTPKSAWGMLHHEGGDDLLQTADGNEYCADGKCKCPNGKKIQPLGDDAYLALYGYLSSAKVTFTHVKLADACKFKTNVTVSGASTMTFTTAYCVPSPGRLTVELPWSHNGVKQGHVTLQIANYTGPGGYQTPPSSATVYDFRTAPSSWELPQSGTVTVTDPGGTYAHGATGTVSTTSYRDNPYSVVTVSGQWTCGSTGSG